MRNVTFMVLEGVDKGRIFRDLSIPVTIGREEGNGLRLNDERVSRYHAKVQAEDGDIIITDLDSTNGTRVNGATVQIRRLRAGDQVSVGRTMLLFGTMEEIAARKSITSDLTAVPNGAQTVRADELAAAGASGRSVPDRRANDQTQTGAVAEWNARDEELPPLPQKLSGAQCARLAEIFDYLHRGLTQACETVNEHNTDKDEFVLGFNEWQMVQAVQMLLARYGRMVAEPEPRN